jgi:hypothetical protein
MILPLPIELSLLTTDVVMFTSFPPEVLESVVAVAKAPPADDDPPLSSPNLVDVDEKRRVRARRRTSRQTTVRTVTHDAHPAMIPTICKVSQIYHYHQQIRHS